MGDTSDEPKSTAFEAATTRWKSGYSPVQNKMYREMLKKKNYGEDLVGEKLKKQLCAQIDQFWMDALKLRCQREMLAENEANIASALWQSVAFDFERLQQEAEHYLITPSPSWEPQSSPTVLPEVLSAEEASFFASFRKLLKEYLIQEIIKAGGDESFSVEIGEVTKIRRDLYEVSCKIFQASQNGGLVLIDADSTRGTREEFQEAIEYLEEEFQNDIPQESPTLPETEAGILSRYRELLPRYLAKSAQEFEIWQRERGIQCACWFEILDAATPVASDHFRVHHRILCRLQDGSVYAPSEFAGELNLGDIETNIRTILEYLNVSEASPTK